MAILRNCFTQPTLEGISKILGDTSSGLTGSEIQHLLAQSKIADASPTSTKWKRIYDAFAIYQNKNQCSNHILNFIGLALAPAKYVNNPEVFAEKRNQINQQLSFIGYQLNENGKFSEIKQASTISEAQRKADDLKTKLEQRKAHREIFNYCKEELLAENYFHSVLEAAKSVFDRIREISEVREDGGKLVDSVFGGDSPILIINNFVSESEKSEHKGFSNLLKGLYGMFRNPTAHEVKIKWEINEEDALDIMSLISYCHKRIDNIHKIR